MTRNVLALATRLGPKEAAEARLRTVAALIQARTNPTTLKNVDDAISLALSHGGVMLAPQALVDVLKHPLCVGEARRLVLEQLGRHYNNRRFADQWELARYVDEKKLALDLLGPSSAVGGTKVP
jgi:hypothetical protein